MPSDKPVQEALFHDRIEDAMGAVIDALGGRKAVAVLMFPDKPPRDAHNLLDAMLNPERREKFAPSQVLWLARRGRDVGCHVLMTYMARETGYEDPVPVDPVDQVTRLQQAFVDSVTKLEGIQRQLQQLGAAQRVRR